MLADAEIAQVSAPEAPRPQSAEPEAAGPEGAGPRSAGLESARLENAGPRSAASGALASSGEASDVLEIAARLRLSVSLLVRRLRLVQPAGELTLGEIAALVRLERGGPSTAAALAKKETISPQSMGATLAGLEDRGLVARRPDPADGRRVILSLAAAGHEALRDRRNARSEQLARALSTGFSDAELDCLKAAGPLLERLAQSL